MHRNIGDIIYQETKKYFEKMLSRAVAVVRFDVTKDVLEEGSGEIFALEKIIRNNQTMTGFIRDTSEHITDKKARNEYIELFDRDSLEKGGPEKVLRTEHTAWYDFGSGKALIRVSLSLRIHPETGHIIAFLGGEDVTGEDLVQRISGKLTEQVYDSILYIDLEKNIYIPYRDLLHENPVDIYAAADEFSGKMKKYIKKYAARDEQERLIQDNSLEEIRAHVQKDGKYTVFSTEIEGGENRKKRTRYLSLDETGREVLSLKGDITDIFAAKERHIKSLRDKVDSMDAEARVRREYIATLTKEIEEPLKVMRDVIDITSENGGESGRDAEKTKSSLRYLEALIGSMKQLYKTGEATVGLSEDVFSVASIVDEILKSVENEKTEKNIEIDVLQDVVTGKSYIGDAVKIQQAITAVVLNAVKFSPMGSTVKLTVRGNNINEKNHILVFGVKDKGCGISEDFKPEIFKPFAAEHRGGCDFGSYGLGLAVAREFVNNMGGQITFESEVDKGSDFTIAIPVKINEAEKYIPEIDDKKEFEGKRILIAEDHDLNVEVTKKILKRKGFTAEVAINGKIAVDKFGNSEENYYDGILMDIRMPVMDGFEATEKIRAMDRKDAKKIPIIALTATALSDENDRTDEVNMDAHLTKPINPKLLYKTLRDLL